MENNKVKKILKKLFLEEKPEKYCFVNRGKELSITFNYKNSEISVNNSPIYQTREIKGWFWSRTEEEVKTDMYRTHVHIYPNDSTIEDLYFRFEDIQIRTWFNKYIERYNSNEDYKKEKFLKSL